MNIHARTCVYNIWYHVVWSTKYRKKILTGQVAEYCRKLFDAIADEFDFQIAEMKIMPDHVHLFLTAHPQKAPGDIVKKLKGISGRKMFIQFPELRKVYWNNKLWNPSTYYGTAGSITQETIQKYIENQKVKA
jgi:putative transposase